MSTPLPFPSLLAALSNAAQHLSPLGAASARAACGGLLRGSDSDGGLAATASAERQHSTIATARPPTLPPLAGINTQGPPAFVFDIDGVLIRGRKVLDAGVQAVQQLLRGGEWRYPVVFLTNGGGVSEAAKADELAGWLGAPVREDQVILSHTPFRGLAPRLGRHPVLVAGRKDSASVAAGYGFESVLTTHHLAAAYRDALPFGAAAAPAAKGGAAPCPVTERGWGTEAAPIRAVLVFCDPAGDSWYQDLQLIHDVITSHGVPLRPHPAPGSSPVEVFFSNPDLLWANEHPRPRFGQGAFAAALDALHRQTHGTPIPRARFFGKPNREPYRLAERLLLRQAVGLGLAPPEALAEGTEEGGSNSGGGGGGSRSSSAAASVFSGIYAIGDNPAADVRGANMAGPPWVSVLVRTGVFEGGANDGADPAHAVVQDAAAAVEAALHRTRLARWHAMR